MDGWAIILGIVLAIYFGIKFPIFGVAEALTIILIVIVQYRNSKPGVK